MHGSHGVTTLQAAARASSRIRSVAPPPNGSVWRRPGLPVPRRHTGGLALGSAGPLAATSHRDDQRPPCARRRLQEPDRTDRHHDAVGEVSLARLRGAGRVRARPRPRAFPTRSANLSAPCGDYSGCHDAPPHVILQSIFLLVLAEPLRTACVAPRCESVCGVCAWAGRMLHYRIDRGRRRAGDISLRDPRASTPLFT